MLVVMAIIAIVITLGAPVMRGLVSGNQVTQATETLTGLFGLARQTALAKNRNVEFRFYQYADPGASGETAGSPTTGKFRAVQIYMFDEAGTTATAVTRMQILPSVAILDAGSGSSGTTLSSLLDTAVDSSLDKTWTSNDPQTKLPTVGTAYNCRAFTFRRDGTTSLNTASQWFITIHEKKDGDKLIAAPLNFATILIDPYNGTTKVMRP
jgi:uncharacterized protein (TIGR02596 family)